MKSNRYTLLTSQVSRNWLKEEECENIECISIMPPPTPNKNTILLLLGVGCGKQITNKKGKLANKSTV
jgi:hypothetical protein